MRVGDYPDYPVVLPLGRGPSLPGGRGRSGGRSAKPAACSPAAARLTVIAPHRFRGHGAEAAWTRPATRPARRPLERRPYRDGEAAGYALVVSATGDEAVDPPGHRRRPLGRGAGQRRPGRQCALGPPSRHPPPGTGHHRRLDWRTKPGPRRLAADTPGPVARARPRRAGLAPGRSPPRDARRGLGGHPPWTGPTSSTSSCPWSRPAASTRPKTDCSRAALLDPEPVVPRPPGASHPGAEVG